MKITKQQESAINTLRYDIDELDNKPRRLFSALRKYTEAFVVVDKKDLDGKEHKNNILDSIDEFENTYYNFFGLPNVMEFLARSIKETKRELTSRNHQTYFETETELSAYKQGVNEATEKLGKKMLEDLIDFYK